MGLKIMGNSKMPIELSPHTALTLCSFLREFDYTQHDKLRVLGDCVTEFEMQVCRNMTEEQFEDAKAEIAVNDLLGKIPTIKE